MAEPIRQIKQNPDGSTKIEYYDPKGGKINIGYADQNTGLGGYADQNYANPQPKPNRGIMIPPELDDGHGTPDRDVKPADFGNNGDIKANAPLSAFDRNDENNFGYKKTPTGLTIASMVPGPLGTFGKVVGAIKNFDDVGAQKAARKSLGLNTKGKMSTLKSVVTGTKGQVGTIKIGEKVFNVSLNPDDPLSITPAKAREIAAEEQAEITEATPEEAKQFRDTVGVEKDKGKLGTVMDAAAKGVDNVLGTKLSAPDPKKSFPATPEAPAQDRAPPGIGPLDQNKKPDFTPNVESVGAVNPGASLGSVPHDNVSYTHPERGAWNANFSEDNLEASAALSNLAPGGIKVTSGYRSPDVNAAVGGAKLSAHTHGDAMDMDLTGLTDQEKADRVEDAKMSGYTGIGAYSKDNSLHVDTMDRTHIQRTPENKGIAYGMFDRSQNNLRNAPGWLTKGLTQVTVPTPQEKPAYTPQPTLNATYGVMEKPNEFTDIGVPSVENNVQPGPMTPSEFSSVGLGAQYSETDKAKMGITAAGELSGDTLRGLEKGDPEAQAEYGSVLGTMDNRAMSNLNYNTPDPVASTLTPSQYNSLMTSPLPGQVRAPSLTTAANFSRYGQTLVNGAQEYGFGALPSATPEATHYNNVPNNPWGAQETQVNEHKFSTPASNLGGYTASLGLGTGPTDAATDTDFNNMAATYGSFAQPAATPSTPSLGGINLGMVDPTSSPAPTGGFSPLGPSLGWAGGQAVADAAEAAKDAQAATKDADMSPDAQGTDVSADKGSEGGLGGTSAGNSGSGGLGGFSTADASADTGPSTSDTDNDNDNDHDSQGRGN